MIYATNNTTSALSSPFTGQSINNVARAVFATVGSIMIVCGVLGNVLLITVIIKNFQRKQYVHNLFIANLALGDILSLGYWLSFLVLDLILGYYPVVNQAHCVVNGMVICTLSMVCVLSLLSISLNRYLHVCHSHLYSRIFTLPRIVIFTICIWVLGILVALPPAVGIGSYHYSAYTHVCSYNRKNVSYAKIMVVFFSATPMMFIGYWNFAIFRFWKKAKMSLKQWYTPAVQKSRRQRKFLTAWRRHLKKNGELAASVSQEKIDGADRPQCEDDRSDHISRISVEDSEGYCFNAAGNVSMSEFRDSHIDSSAHESGESEDDNRSPTKIKTFPDDKAKRNKLECTNATLSSSDTEFGLQKRKDDTEDDNLNQGNHDHNGAEPLSKEKPISKLSKENGTKMSGKGTVTAGSIETLTVPERAPSSSPASSFRLTHSSSSHQKHHMTAVTQNLQRKRKKQNAREVAFVRSLFVIFILMCSSFIPYGLSVVISSYVTVPPEYVLTGILLLFTNNTVNWIVYGVMNPSFRKAYMKCGRQLLQKCCGARQDQTEGTPNNNSQSNLMATSVQGVKPQSKHELSSSCQAESGFQSSG